MAFTNVNFPNYRGICDQLDEWEFRSLRLWARWYEATIRNDFYQVHVIDGQLAALNLQRNVLQGIYAGSVPGVEFDRGIILSSGACVRALRRAMDYRGYLHVHGDDLEGFEGYFYRYRIASSVRQPAQDAIIRVGAEWGVPVPAYGQTMVAYMAPDGPVEVNVYPVNVVPVNVDA